jgi:hypothetical protein
MKISTVAISTLALLCATLAFASCGSQSPSAPGLAGAPGTGPASSLKPRLMELHPKSTTGSCPSPYAQCVTISPSEPYSGSWCINYGTGCDPSVHPTWYGIVYHVNPHKVYKKISSSYYPNPGNPTTVTISDDGAKPTKGIQNELMFWACITASDCTGPVYIGITVSHGCTTGKGVSPAEICPSPSPAPVLMGNTYQSPPPGNPTDYEIVFSGDVANDISRGPYWPIFNPFCPPSNGYGCFVNVTYNPKSNTTVAEYSGTALYLNDPNCAFQPCYHFGILGNGAQVLKERVEWTYPSNRAVAWNLVNVNLAKEIKLSTKWSYATVFVSASLTPSENSVVGSWYEIGYVPKGTTQPKFTFTNYGKQTLYVQSSGIILNQPVPTDPACQQVNPPCAEDLSILQSLNFAGNPPPGYSNSQFVPLQYPPPSVLYPKKMKG